VASLYNVVELLAIGLPDGPDADLHPEENSANRDPVSAIPATPRNTPRGAFPMAKTSIQLAARSGCALALAVLATVTAACGSSSHPAASAKPSSTTTTIATGKYAGGVKITYWSFGADADYGTLLTRFNRKYSGKYYVEFREVPYTDYAALLSTAITSHTEPDIFEGSFTPSIYFAYLNLEVPIVPLLHDGGIHPTRDFPSSLWNKTSVNGVHYAAPVDAFGTALFYNKALFKKAGLNPNDPPTTGAALITDAEQMKRSGKVPYPIIQGVGKGTNDFEYPSLVYQFGGTMGNPATGKAEFDSTAGKAALNWEKSLIFTYKVAPKAPSTGEDLTEFADGKEGMAILPAINDVALAKDLKGNLGMVPLPKIGYNRDDFLGQNYWWVFKAPNMNANTEKGIGLLFGYLYRHSQAYAAGGTVPSYLPVANSSSVKSALFYRSQVAMVTSGRINPAIPNWGTVTAVPLYDYVENALLGRESVSAALAQAAVKTDELVRTLPGFANK